MRSAVHRATFVAALCGMSVLAWLALWRLEGTAYGHALHPLGATGPHAHHGAAASPAGAAGLFLGGWVLMTIAMMLPTTLPLVGLFQRLTRDRPDGALLNGLLVGGYVLAWTLFGVVALGVSSAFGLLGGRIVPDALDGATAGGILMLGAGAFQFSPLKYRCLDKCRSPLLFLTERWQGARERWQAFRIGVDHGIFCVGCCWALMLLMLAVTTAGLAAMLGLGAVMAVEKNVSWGRRIAAPVGIVLIVAGLATLGSHAASH
jgi:predicted metal-binding membrane protein